MYRRLLVPLDGSRTAAAVLPYARTIAKTLKLPVELLGVVDIGALAAHVSHGGTRYFETIIAGSVRISEQYLKRIAKTFPDHEVKCTVEKGKAEDVIIEKAGSDATLTANAEPGVAGQRAEAERGRKQHEGRDRIAGAQSQGEGQACAPGGSAGGCAPAGAVSPFGDIPTPS